ncbi:TPA: hypothetical protein ACPVY1_000190 [Vibrio parahaemolyticus]
MNKKITKKQKIETLSFAHDVIRERMNWAYETIRSGSESKDDAVDGLLEIIKEAAQGQRYIGQVSFLIGGSMLTKWVYEGYHAIAIKVLSDAIRPLYDDYEFNKDYIDQVESAIEFFETLYAEHQQAA